jgi:hypothetical protein
VDISNLGLGELKILAYNTSRTLNVYSRDLQVIENLIAQREKDEKPNKVSIKPVEEQGKEVDNKEDNKVVENQ